MNIINGKIIEDNIIIFNVVNNGRFLNSMVNFFIMFLQNVESLKFCVLLLLFLFLLSLEFNFDDSLGVIK